MRWGNVRNDLFRTVDQILILRVTHITYDHSEIALSFSVIIKLPCKPNTQRDNMFLTLGAQKQKHFFKQQLYDCSLVNSSPEFRDPKVRLI